MFVELSVGERRNRNRRVLAGIDHGEVARDSEQRLRNCIRQASITHAIKTRRKRDQTIDRLHLAQRSEHHFGIGPRLLCESRQYLFGQHLGTQRDLREDRITVTRAAEQSRLFCFMHEQPPMRRIAVRSESGEHRALHALDHPQFLLSLRVLGAGDGAAFGVGRPCTAGDSATLGATLDRRRHQKGDEQQGAADYENPLVVLSKQLEHGWFDRVAKGQRTRSSLMSDESQEGIDRSTC